MHRLPASFPLPPDRESALAGPADPLGDGVHHLRHGEAIRIRPARPTTVMVWAGRLWLTRVGDRVDHFPGPGQCVALAAGADVVVEADLAGGATFSLAGDEGQRSPERKRERDGAAAGAMTPLSWRRRWRLAWFQAWRRWWPGTHWRRRRTEAALSGLSPAQLRDIALDEAVATRLWLRQERRDAAIRARLEQGGGW